MPHSGTKPFPHPLQAVGVPTTDALHSDGTKHVQASHLYLCFPHRWHKCYKTTVMSLKEGLPFSDQLCHCLAVQWGIWIREQPELEGTHEDHKSNSWSEQNTYKSKHIWSTSKSPIDLCGYECGAWSSCAAEEPYLGWLENRKQFNSWRTLGQTVSHQLKSTTVFPHSRTNIFCKKSFFFFVK